MLSGEIRKLLLIVLSVALAGVVKDAVAQSAPRFDTTAETTHRKVTWADFKGRETRSNRWEGGAWAHIATVIKLNNFKVETGRDGDDFVVRPVDLAAYAIMDKHYSAYAPGANKTHTLAHEQLHFDVTETYARRLTLEARQLEGRGATAQHAAQDLKAKLDRAYLETQKKLDATQNAYDGETRHGTRKKIQAKWSERIGEMFAEATRALDAAASASAEAVKSPEDVESPEKP